MYIVYLTTIVQKKKKSNMASGNRRGSWVVKIDKFVMFGRSASSVQSHYNYIHIHTKNNIINAVNLCSRHCRIDSLWI